MPAGCVNGLCEYLLRLRHTIYKVLDGQPRFGASGAVMAHVMHIDGKQVKILPNLARLYANNLLICVSY